MDARARQRLRVHLQLIDQGVAPVVARYRRYMQCAPGCASCCSQAFAITRIEAEYLALGLASLPVDTRRAILERAQSHSAGQPCPVLDDAGHCQLYEHRPRICRKYGIPLWNPEDPGRVHTCELNFRELVDLDPDLIVDPQAKWAADWIELRDELARPSTEKRSIAAWLADSKVVEIDHCDGH